MRLPPEKHNSLLSLTNVEVHLAQSIADFIQDQADADELLVDSH